MQFGNQINNCVTRDTLNNNTMLKNILTAMLLALIMTLLICGVAYLSGTPFNSVAFGVLYILTLMYFIISVLANSKS